MKTIAKRLFATVLALALMCTMVTGFAANTASVTQVRILDSADDTTPDVYNTFDENIEVTEGQLIEVTAQLTDAETEEAVAGDLTFLSRLAGEGVVLSNDTIQYVTQVSVTAETNTATITFRPRATIGTGAFSAKVGGTAVATAATFDYDVLEAKEQLGLTAVNASIKEDSADDITFTVTGYVGGQAFEAVAIDGVALAADAWAFDTDTKVLTIYNNKLASKAVKTYTVTISGSHYLDGVGEFEITKKDPVVLNLKAVDDVVTLPENSDDNIQFTIEGYTEGDLTITLTLNGEAVEADIEREGNLLVIKNKAVGNYVVTVSGEDYVTDTAEFEITKKPDTQLTLDPKEVNIELSATNDIEFTLGSYTDGDLVVTLGAATLVKDADNGYALNGTTLTIKNAAIPNVIEDYTLTVDGEGYDADTATIHVIADAAIKLTLANGNSIEEESGDSVSFDITGYDPSKAIVVAVGTAENVIDASLYTVENGKLVIQYAGLVTTAGQHTVYVSGDAYESATATYIVTEKVVVPPVTPDDPIEDEEVANDAQDAINNLDPEVSVNADGVIESVTLQDKVQVGETEYNVTNNVVTSDAALTYDANTGVISYNPDEEGAHFVSKAVIKTSISSTAGISKTETIYFIPKDTKITFGNVTAIANSDGDDAFGTKADFENALANNSTELLATRVNALNAVLGRKANIAQEIETLDYDQNTTITLNEYRIFKLMLDNDADNHPAFLYENVIGNRDDYKVSE